MSPSRRKSSVQFSLQGGQRQGAERLSGAEHWFSPRESLFDSQLPYGGSQSYATPALGDALFWSLQSSGMQTRH